MLKQVSILLIISLLFSCKVDENESTANASYSPIKISGAMRNVMWKGELRGIINLDTIANKKGLYGLGPQAFLAGELLINDGKSYVSKVLTDSTMSVEKTYDLEAPFLVYGNVNEWKGIDLPDN
ncbi:MAG: alpha-acetolactate decarboxylase, partial [Bacteroidetes bacterium]|nr:alpha-acetolactate decarboxylase [Bacteroidota bacterium]